MKEAEEVGKRLQEGRFSAEEMTEMIRLSELLHLDGLRYERWLDVGEEMNEL